MFKNYNLTDRGTAKLDGDIVPSDVILNLVNIEELPESNSAITLVQSLAGVFVKSEKIYYTTRTGNVLTGVTRGYAGSTAKSFNDGDDIRLNIIAEHIIDIQVEVARLETAKSNTGHTHTFDSLTSKPTTLFGYGITDAYTEVEMDALLSLKGDLEGGNAWSGDQEFTGKVNLTNSAIFGVWTESGQAVEDGGIRRFINDGGNYRIDRNTAVAGDFSSHEKDFIIDKNGLVGFGKTPLEKVDVNGNIKAVQFLTSNYIEANSGISGQQIRFGGTSRHLTTQHQIFGTINMHLDSAETKHIYMQYYSDGDLNILNGGGQLNASGNIFIGNGTGYFQVTTRANGLNLFRFDTDRAWVFKQTSSGSTTALTLQTENDGKTFNIANLDGTNLVEFKTSNSYGSKELYVNGGLKVHNVIYGGVGTDLDTVLVGGWYNYDNPTNSPSGSTSWGYLEVMQHNNGRDTPNGLYVTQKWTDLTNTNGGYWVRIRSNSIWGPWRSLI